MKLLIALLVLASIAFVSAQVDFPDPDCAGTDANPLPDSQTVALAPPFLMASGAVTVGERGSTNSVNSDVDSANVRILFRASNKYRGVKFEMISPTSTPLSNDIQTTKPCNGYFNFGGPSQTIPNWTRRNQWCSTHFNWPYPGTASCGCNYTPYFVFSMETDAGLPVCFVRSEGTEAVNNQGTQTFYYFDTVVESTYSVSRPTIRNKPVVRNVISQTRIRYKFQKTIALSTVNKAIFVGGLRQVYADIILLQFNPLAQSLYIQIFTSVQWPYQLFTSVRQNGADGSGLNVGVVPYPSAAGPGFTVVAPGLVLQPNTTSGKNCGVFYENLCEQVWEVNLTMPAYSETAFYCNMNPAIHVLYDVGCQQLYLDEGANCTVGTETAKADFSWINLPASDFCVKIVQSVSLSGSITPYPSLVLANTGANNAVYSYIFGGPIFLRIGVTVSSSNGVLPTIEAIRLNAVRVFSGAALLSVYTFNLSNPDNDLVWFNSGTLGQNWMVFTFRLNGETVTLASFDANQQVVIEADVRVSFQKINPGGFSKGMALQQEEQEVSDATVSAQFFVSSSAEQAGSVSAGSSMNVVAVAAGSAAGVVALTVIIAFIVHRRATKKILAKTSAPASGKDVDEEVYETNSMGSGSSV